MKWKLVLDHADIIQDYVPVDDLQPGEVGVDHEPDLPKGKYRWNGESAVPARAEVPFTPDGPDAWYAMYAMARQFIIFMDSNGVAAPRELVAWVNYYARSYTRDPVIK